MQVTSSAGTPLAFETPALIYPVWEGETLPEQLAGLFESADFSGSPKKMQVLYPNGAVAARRVVLLGLGKRETATSDGLRDAAAVAAQALRDLKVAQAAMALPDVPGMAVDGAAQTLTEGVLLGLYRFDTYKSDAKESALAGVTILASDADADAVARGVAAGTAIAGGAVLARDLANQPGNVLNPAGIASAAEQLGIRHGIEVTVYDRAALEQEGFGGILAVGGGSANEPRFIIMEYGKAFGGQPLCLVGKGISFDTGGISIKPADSMELMKMDMGGAAAVLGAMQAIAELQLPLYVVALISSAENMPSGTAYRPGDIVRTLSGKTIEVINTDAEGRVVLADALHYAKRYNPSAVIDLATLTGAVTIALGPFATGMISTDDALAAEIAQAGDTTDERVWRLPLWDGYREMVKSDVADVKNSAGRPGGTITGAAFLAAFIGDYPWAHLDIAGTAWTTIKPKAYTPSGATGVGVRLLVELARKRAAAA